MPPPNDAFASAELLTGDSGSVQGDNTDATTQASDPLCAALGYGGGANVWYRWVAPSEGILSVRTDDPLSGTPIFDTTLGVFSGTTYGTLVLLAADDDDHGPFYSLVNAVPVSAGDTIYIEVDGYSGNDCGALVPGDAAQGAFTLTWAFENTAAESPDNTTCATAHAITGTSGSVIADNTTANDFDFATDPLFNDDCYGFGEGGGGPLWWKYRNPFSRPILLRIRVQPAPSGDSIDAALYGIFRGSCGTVERDIYTTGGDIGTIAGYTRFDPTVAVTTDFIDAVIAPGETVYIEVDGYSGDTTDPITLPPSPNRGRFRLRWSVLSVTFQDAIEESVAAAEANCATAGDSFDETGSTVEEGVPTDQLGTREHDYVEFDGDSWYTTLYDAAFPHAPLLDDFNRADANPLDGNWTTPFTSFGVVSAMKLVSNEAAGTGAGLNTAGWTTAFSPDVEVGAFVSVLPGSGVPVRLFVRMNGGNGYMARFDSTQSIVISRLDGGVATVIAFEPFAATTLVVGSQIRLRAEGDTITAQIFQPGHTAWLDIVATDATYSGGGKVGVGIQGTTGRLENVTATTSDFPSVGPPAIVFRWDPDTETEKGYVLPVKGNWMQTEILLNHDGETLYALTTENGGLSGDGWPNPSAGATGSATEPDRWFPAHPVSFAYNPGTDSFDWLGAMEPKAGNTYGLAAISGSTGFGHVGSFDTTAHSSMPGRVYIVWSEKGINGTWVTEDGADYQWIEHMAVGCYGSAAPFEEFDIGLSSMPFNDASVDVEDSSTSIGDTPYYVPGIGYALLANDQEVCQLFRIEPQLPADLEPGAGFVPGPRYKDTVRCEQVEDAASLTLKIALGYEPPPGYVGAPATLGNNGYADGIALEPVCHGETALDSAVVWGFVRQGDAFPGNRPDWTTLPRLGITGVLWRDIDPTFDGADIFATRNAGFQAGIWTNAESGQSASSFATQASDLVIAHSPDLLVLDVETRYGTDPSANWTWHDDMVAAFRALQPTQRIAVTMGPLKDDFNYGAYTSADAEVWPQSYGALLSDHFDPVVVFDRVVANGVSASLVAPVLAAPSYPADVATLAAAGHSKWSVFTLDDRPRPPASGEAATETETLRTVLISWRSGNYPTGPPDTGLLNLAYNLDPLLAVPERWFNDNAQANGNDVRVVIPITQTIRPARRTLYRDRYGETWAFMRSLRTAVVYDRFCERQWTFLATPVDDQASNVFTAEQRMRSGRQVVWDEPADIVRTVTSYQKLFSATGNTHRYLAVAHMKILRKWVACEIGNEVEDVLSGNPFIVFAFKAASAAASPISASDFSQPLHIAKVSFRAKAPEASPVSPSADSPAHLAGIRFRV